MVGRSGTSQLGVISLEANYTRASMAAAERQASLPPWYDPWWVRILAKISRLLSFTRMLKYGTCCSTYHLTASTSNTRRAVLEDEASCDWCCGRGPRASSVGCGSKQAGDPHHPARKGKVSANQDNLVPTVDTNCTLYELAASSWHFHYSYSRTRSLQVRWWVTYEYGFAVQQENVIVP